MDASTIDKESEHDLLAPGESLRVSANLCLTYMGASGKITERGLRVREIFSAPYGLQLIGYCCLREETRTFQVERIIRCVDNETGRLVDNVVEFLLHAYRKSSDYSIYKLYRSHYDVLQVWLYVAKADGQFRADERRVITAACKVITRDVRITEEHVTDMLRGVNLLGLHAFKIAVGKIAKRDDFTKSRTLKASQAIVATQKTVCAAEQEALDYMIRRLS